MFYINSKLDLQRCQKQLQNAENRGQMTSFYSDDLQLAELHPYMS